MALICNCFLFVSRISGFHQAGLLFSSISIASNRSILMTALESRFHYFRPAFMHSMHSKAV